MNNKSIHPWPVTKFLFLCFGHGTFSIKTKRYIAIMAKDSITRRISKLLKFSIENRTSPCVFVFTIPIDMIYRKELNWVRPTGFPFVIAGANSPAVCGNHGNSMFISRLFVGLASVLSPIRIGNSFVDSVLFVYFFKALSVIVLPFLLSGTKAFRGAWFMCIRAIICGRARIGTKLSNFSFRVERFFAQGANVSMHNSNLSWSIHDYQLFFFRAGILI